MFLRAGITGALIQIGYPAVPGLTGALFDPSNAVKRAACKAFLGKIGSERAVPALIFSLNDRNAGHHAQVRARGADKTAHRQPGRPRFGRKPLCGMAA